MKRRTFMKLLSATSGLFGLSLPERALGLHFRAKILLEEGLNK